ncbi:ImmA/IrrE family metallo-endopeptidase [Companilactobacillus metriopterae]|uniref:ImmA/IrrE family metallo-endopeptidase n=1 Tax=Companilactobacillus metriopterae TaxID=1909267 RepID=UPI0013E95D81|nr:ImmA/IrrE family metallo-endopeptidase [Companilactobacillus metriopterae]
MEDKNNIYSESLLNKVISLNDSITTGNYIDKLLESFNIKVFDLPIEKTDPLLMRIKGQIIFDSGIYAIGINPFMDGSEKQYTILHEIYHLIIDSKVELNNGTRCLLMDSINNVSILESEKDYFAECFIKKDK